MLDVITAPFRVLWGFLSGVMFLAGFIAMLLIGTGAACLLIGGVVWMFVTRDPVWLVVAAVGLLALTLWEALAQQLSDWLNGIA